jgi:hypothetical protein
VNRLDSDFKRDRGFLTFAQNGKTDYVRLAYALALSLRATQTEVPHLSVVVTPGTKVPERYLKVFDEVIDVPWIDEASSSQWKLENEWKAYHVTPYRETIKLDADMLFPIDIKEWWEVLAQQNFCAATLATTYRGETVTNDFYRKTFTSNELPNVYSAFTYFRFSDTSQSVFEMMEIIFHNWDHFSFNYLDDTRPENVSTDVVMALALKLLGLQDAGTAPPHLPIPRFTHMKSKLQGWPEGAASEDWLKHIDVNLTPDLKILIGRHRQMDPLHYHLKDFVTDNMIQTYEKALGIR